MAAKSDKVIITCAITGSIHTPTMSDALPVTPDQIAQQAIAAAEAGAAILHLHARNPQDGTPDRRSRGVPAVPSAHQAGDRRRGQHHDRRIADHDGRRAAGGGIEVVAGNVLAQHGFDEFRALSHGARLQDMETRLGEAISARLRPDHLPQHLRRHREDFEADGRGARHQVRARMLRHRASLQSRPLRRPRLVQAADLPAADLRHSRRHRQPTSTT